MASTLIIGGFPVTEFSGSGNLSISETDVTGTRVFKCAYKDRMAVTRGFIGFATQTPNGETTVTGGLPYDIKGDPAIFAKSATVNPFTANAQEDTNQQIEYEFAVITVTYKPRDNIVETTISDIGVVTDDEGTGGDEASLIMTLSVSSSVENVSIPDSEKGWSFRVGDQNGYGAVTPDGTVKKGSLNRLVPFLEWTLDYKKIEDIQLSKIRFALRNPLHSTAANTNNPSATDGTQSSDVRGLGSVLRGAMLFLGFSASQDTVILQGGGLTSKKAWRIRYRFKEHPYGWNYIFRGKPDLNSRVGSLPRAGWWPVMNNADNKPLYSVSNFNNFLPPVNKK